MRIDVSGQVKAGPHFALLGEMRTENGGRPLPYAFYLRIRPWTARDFDIQVGRVPPTFGALLAPHVRQRQPAHRLSARVSVPDHAPARLAARRAPTSCCASAAAAGWRYSIGDATR